MTSDKPVYLDHHSTTPVDPRVIEAMLPFFSERFGNAASINHAFGWEAADAVAAARGQVAELFGGDPREIVFTSGATEADNLALKGVLMASSSGGHLIVNAAEHRAVLDPARRLERRGCDVTVLPVDATGRVAPESVRDAIRPRTKLVSVMLANNEIGTINPVADIAEVCHERGVLLHCDAVQAAGRIPIDVKQLGADLLSVTAHKIYGPKGVGALYVRRGAPRVVLEPQIDGGGHERGLRSGTLPVPLIVAFGAASRLAGEVLAAESSRIAGLTQGLWSELQSQLSGVHLNGPALSDRLPGNLNVSFESVDGDALMTGLKKIAVSSGSACTSNDPEPSHVLRAIGRDGRLTRASLRFGIGRGNTPEDIAIAVEEVVATVKRLRQG
jgi:cysteine desulfurase